MFRKIETRKAKVREIHLSRKEVDRLFSVGEVVLKLNEKTGLKLVIGDV